MSDLAGDLARTYEARVAAVEVDLTPAAIRTLVRQLGGGEGRKQVAEGNKELAGQLGVSVRTVQRWQKEGGQGEARNIARSTPGLKISVRGIATAEQRRVNVQQVRQQVMDNGLDVDGCRVMVLVYNEDRARPRNIPPVHLSGESLIEAFDALEDGDTAAAAEAFGDTWLEAYGMDVDASVTDVIGTFGVGL